MLTPVRVGTTQCLAGMRHTTLVVAWPRTLAKRVRTIDLGRPEYPPPLGGQVAS